MICDITGCPWENRPLEDGSRDTGVLNHLGYLCTEHDGEWRAILKEDNLPDAPVPTTRRRYVKYKLVTENKYVKSDMIDNSKFRR